MRRAPSAHPKKQPDPTRDELDRVGLLIARVKTAGEFHAAARALELAKGPLEMLRITRHDVRIAELEGALAQQEVRLGIADLDIHALIASDEEYRKREVGVTMRMLDSLRVLFETSAAIADPAERIAALRGIHEGASRAEQDLLHHGAPERAEAIAFWEEVGNELSTCELALDEEEERKAG